MVVFLRSSTLLNVLFGAALVIGTAIGAGGPASAGHVGCDASYADNLTPNSGCALGHSNNDTLNPTLAVNNDEMFGHTNWAFLEKTEGINDTSGSFSLDADFWDKYSRALVVFKDGSAPGTVPLVYVGYLLLEANGTSFTWTSPFTQDGGKLKDVSHISLYVAPVPLPAALPLLVAALAGLLGVFGWRRRKLTRAAAA